MLQETKRVTVFLSVCLNTKEEIKINHKNLEAYKAIFLP